MQCDILNNSIYLSSPCLCTPMQEKHARNERVAASDYSIVPLHFRLALSGMRQRWLPQLGLKAFCFSILQSLSHKCF